jgi:hypothetical protein
MYTFFFVIFLLPLSLATRHICDDNNPCTVDLQVDRDCFHQDIDVVKQVKCDSICGGKEDGYCGYGKCIPYELCNECETNENCSDIDLDFLEKAGFYNIGSHQFQICLLQKCQYHFFLEEKVRTAKRIDGEHLCLEVAFKKDMDCEYIDSSHTKGLKSTICVCHRKM